MSVIKILITDEIDLSGLSLLPKNKFFIECQFGISSSEITKSYKEFDILLIRSIRKITKDFLDNTSFKVIATCSKGTDHIDTAYAKRKGVIILNADDANTISAAEHTMGLILAIEKNIILSDSLVRKDNFGFYNYERNEIKDMSIGIIGFGKVGSYVGKLAEAFGMNVYANDTDKKIISKNRKIKFKSLKFILNKCDIVSIHIPLTNKNYKYFSEKKLRLLNKNSILINTSRGDVIDEIPLLEMLKNRKIKFAGLDVFSGEPFINRAFKKLDNVILTNHIAGKTTQSKRRISENIFRQIKNLKLSMSN